MKKNIVLFLAILSGNIILVSAQKNIINLSSNENPNGVTKGVVAAIQKEIPHINRYAAKDGAAFVQYVANVEKVKPSQIVIGEDLEALGIYLSLKKGKNAKFIYSVPGYPALVNAGASVGGTIISIPLNNQGENDLPAIEAAIDEHTAAVYLVNPHNPTGTFSDPKIFHDFIHRISQKVVVVVDEAYLEYTGVYKQATAINNVKEGDNVIVFKTLAKAYGLGGLDIGYSIASDSLADLLHSKGVGDTHSLNRIAIAAAREVLADTIALNHTIELAIKERDKWEKFFATNHLKYTNSKASYVFFDLGIKDKNLKQLYLDKGILIGNAYPPYDSWVRITIGNPEENEKARAVTLEILKNR